MSDVTKEDLEWAESQCAGHKLLPRDEAERTHEMKLMTGGKLYWPMDPVVRDAHVACQMLMYAYNQTSPVEQRKRKALLKVLMGSCEDDLYVEPTIKMDFGRNTRFGKCCYLNYDCVILDVAHVTIGDNFFAAPGVHIYTATHPTDPTLRGYSGRELGFPVAIGNNVWLGGRVVVCPGVTIGDNAVAGAGCVIAHDVPPCSIVVGNPARIVKTVSPCQEGVPRDFLVAPSLPVDFDKDGRALPRQIEDDDDKKDDKEQPK